MSNLLDAWKSAPSTSKNIVDGNKVVVASTPSVQSKEIDCEGYVTKQGHLVKNWRLRYLTFVGETKTCCYYDSKTLKQSGAVAKGSFIVTSIQKQEFDIGVVNKTHHPFGFKMIGHVPGKGYHELLAYVESKADLARWYLHVNNALRAEDHKPEPSPTKTASNGHSFNVISLFKGHTSDSSKTVNPSSSPRSANQQVAASQKRTHNYLQQAIRDAEASRQMGAATCDELNRQAETIDSVEANLDEMNAALDRGETLLADMKNPMFGIFRTTGAQSKAHHQEHDTGAKQRISPNNVPKQSTSKNDELSQLSSILSDLQFQAQAIGEEADRSNDQLTRISDKSDQVNERILAQTKTADDIAKKGNIW